MNVSDKVALVTGAGSGLGEGTARHLHSLGASVVLFDIDESKIRSIAEELGDGAEFVGGDATSEADTAIAVSRAGEFGPLRLVVACAGGGSRPQRLVNRDGSPHELGLFKDTLDLNLVTTFNTLRQTAAAMAATEGYGTDGERGSIVLTSSLAGYEGQIGTIAYSTAKAGIIGMTLVAARDLATSGIRVNCIAPGTMNTPAWEQVDPEVRASLEANVPFPKRFGEIGEFADLAVHLLTNQYLNGCVVRLDGAIRFGPK
ncbi:MAG TPA: SDR family NAD(P)-dependent oxidoreductase [Acidimicrobiales bacterium]|nr:SDR family NAD(P)-dependent oxidoreductase [Acidimicrobiales bacterium]